MGVNYHSTLIAVAEDCPVARAVVPPYKEAAPSIAALQYRLLAERPYALTSEDLLFEVHAIRQGIPQETRASARAAFFARSQACLRASPLPKSYGWGLHHDAEGRVALVAVESDWYRELLAGAHRTAVVRAMRRSRAR
jgi:hypothetical protein